MIRLFNAYFPTRIVVLGISEALLVTLSFMLASFLWLGALEANFALVYQNEALKVGVVTVVLTFCMYYFDLYDSIILSNRREVAIRIVQVLGTACIVLSLLYRLYPALGLSGGVFALGLVLVTVLLIAVRRIFLLLNRTARMSQRAVFVGDGLLAFALGDEIGRRPELGINILGYIAAEAKSGKQLKRVAALDEMSEAVKHLNVQRIIVTMSDRRGSLPVDTLLRLKTQGVMIQDGADVFESVTGRVALESLRVSWLLFSPGFQASRFMRFYKRFFDMLCSGAGLLLATPLSLLIWIAIRLDSAGPAIFKQTRIGKDGRPFTLFKFRSMLADAGHTQNHRPAEKDDARFTRVGRWLRRSRLDELPQLLNILIGDMSFVGPRPFVPDQEEECATHIPFYGQRWAVKPGATGWAQVHRGYCATLEDNAEKLSYDLFYIKNMSVGLDFLIMFLTVKILLLGRGGQ